MHDIDNIVWEPKRIWQNKAIIKHTTEQMSWLVLKLSSDCLLSLVHHSSSKHHIEKMNRDKNAMILGQIDRPKQQTTATQQRLWQMLRTAAKGQQIDKCNGFHFPINSITVDEAEKWKAEKPCSRPATTETLDWAEVKTICTLLLVKKTNPSQLSWHVATTAKLRINQTHILRPVNGEISNWC